MPVTVIYSRVLGFNLKTLFSSAVYSISIPMFFQKLIDRFSLRVSDQLTLLIILLFGFLGTSVVLYFHKPVPRDETVFPSSAFILSSAEREGRRKGKEDGNFRISSSFSADYQYLADLNSANSSELEILPGIGPSIAEKIIENRNLRGPFHSREELKEVKGIGSKKYESIEPFLMEIDPANFPPRAPLKPPLVDLNSAGREELSTIPGIGPQTAGEILRYRTENGLFKKNDELMNVKGIGPKSYEKIAPYLKEI